jgi:hypothetical protein
MRTWAGWLMLGLAVVLGAGSSAQAYFLDESRNFDVRMRAYSQLGILTDSATRVGCVDAQGRPTPATCPPNYHAGDLAQHRNFYNPEFDAKLTDYTTWSRNVPGFSLLSPDDLKFRFAWWGFYDGLYDYLNPEWNNNRRALLVRVSQSDNPRRQSFNFSDQNKNPRHIYASRNRINELYVDYTKGPLFVRVGRQAISWGESDSIALLDVQNPFDLTLGAPGFFQDVDEARIPLWTLRTTMKLVDNWRALSSFFADAYVVPGPIDTTVSINPFPGGGVSPFAPDVADPQLQVAGQTVPLMRNGHPVTATVHLTTVDQLPENTWANTRWGARLTGVLLRDYTVQTWFFRTFNQAPIPILASPGGAALGLAGQLNPTLIDDRGFRVPVCNGINSGTGFGVTPSGRPCSRALPIVTVLDRRLESVIGVAATWFSQPVNGIIRTEAEYFIDELAFIPTQNLNARSQLPASLIKSLGGTPVGSSMPKADYLRFELGYDRFFYIRPLNPTNSFTLSMAFVGSLNTSERGGMDFRADGAMKPGSSSAQIGRVPGMKICDQAATLPPALKQLCVTTNPKAFEDQYPFEGFLQTALVTDYMHGKLEPRAVIITDVSGIFAFAPTATYRFTDNFLGTITYLSIEGSRKAGLATFREHDMVQLRLTYQLN